MVEYTEDPLIWTTRPHDGLIVLACNAQGVIEYDPSLSTLPDAFPKTYKAYMHMCIHHDMAAGCAYFFTEDHYDIILLCTATKVIGTNKDKPGEVLMNTRNAIDNMVELISDKDIILTHIMNRKYCVWAPIAAYLKTLKQRTIVHRR